MRIKIMLSVVAAFVAVLALAPGAFAWNGEKVDLVSCGEVDISVPHENGPWGYEIRQWTGLSSVVLSSGTTPSPLFGTKHLSIGVRGTDAAEHLITVKVGNASNLNDGANGALPDGSGYFTNCGPLPPGQTGSQGEDGPEGPKGDPGYDGQDGTDGAAGVGYACDGSPVYPEVYQPSDRYAEEWDYIEVPTCPGEKGEKGDPGSNGSNGSTGTDGAAGAAGVTTNVTVVERVPAATPRACVSHRRFTVLLPKDLRGVKKIRVNFAGKVTTMNVSKGGRIVLDFRGHRCGQYAVAIHKKGKKAVKLLYTLGGDKNGGGNLTAFNVPPQRAPAPDPAPTR